MRNILDFITEKMTLRLSLYLMNFVTIFVTLIILLSIKYDWIRFEEVVITIKKVHFGLPITIGVFLGIFPTLTAFFTGRNGKVRMDYNPKTPFFFLLFFLASLMLPLIGSFVGLKILFYGLIIFLFGNSTTWILFFVGRTVQNYRDNLTKKEEERKLGVGATSFQKNKLI